MRESKIIILLFALQLCLTDVFAIDYKFEHGKGVAFNWESKDKACAYTIDSERLVLRPNVIKEDGCSVQFKLNGWSMVPGTEFFAYYPYSTSYVQHGNTLDELPISYIGQKQEKNDTTSHLSAYDFMYAQSTATTDEETVFAFNHFGAVLRLAFYISEKITFSGLSLSSEEREFVTEATMNLLEKSITPTATSPFVSLSLDGIEVEAEDSLIAYMMLAPCDLSGDSLKLTLTDKDGDRYVAFARGIEIKAGVVYCISLDGITAEKGQGGEAKLLVSSPYTHSYVEKILNANGIMAAPNVLYPNGKAEGFDVDYGIEQIIVTGIRNVREEYKQNKIYDMMGRRLTHDKMQKGCLYIVNGKKLIVR